MSNTNLYKQAFPSFHSEFHPQNSLRISFIISDNLEVCRQSPITSYCNEYQINITLGIVSTELNIGRITDSTPKDFDKKLQKTPIRSKTSIRGKSKKLFIDSSIAVAALGLSPEVLMQDLNTFGFIFENLCIRDLKVYSSALGGQISYYHDRFALEADAVLHLNDGRYALIEFKIGSRDIEEASKHLLQLKELIIKYNQDNQTSKLREPDLLVVITGGELAYTRKDGVKIIPIGCLKD